MMFAHRSFYHSVIIPGIAVYFIVQKRARSLEGISSIFLYSGPEEKCREKVKMFCQREKKDYKLRLSEVKFIFLIPRRRHKIFIISIRSFTFFICKKKKKNLNQSETDLWNYIFCCLSLCSPLLSLLMTRNCKFYFLNSFVACFKPVFSNLYTIALKITYF